VVSLCGGRVKVFQLSDGKISARFWHIATRRQMWLQLKTVTPHANQPKQLRSEVDSNADPFTQVSQPEHAPTVSPPGSSSDPGRGTDNRQPTETWQTAKKEFIISVLIAFFILSKFQRQPDPRLELPLSPTPDVVLHVQATSFTNKQLFARNSIMPFNNPQLGSKCLTRTKRKTHIAGCSKIREKTSENVAIGSA